MNIDSNSFFFRYYLGYSKSNLYLNPHPESICDLVWRFVKRTALYALLLDILLSTAYSFIAMGLLGNWERNELGKVLYSGHYGSTLDILVGIPAMAGQTLLALASIVALIIGALYCFARVVEWVWTALPKKVTNTTVDVITDISNSVRGKSCAKVNILNLPKDNYSDHD